MIHTFFFHFKLTDWRVKVVAHIIRKQFVSFSSPRGVETICLKEGLMGFSDFSGNPPSLSHHVESHGDKRRLAWPSVSVTNVQIPPHDQPRRVSLSCRFAAARRDDPSEDQCCQLGFFLFLFCFCGATEVSSQFYSKDWFGGKASLCQK